jgi:uncharacterized repeat protein (TIGR03803 family)
MRIVYRGMAITLAALSLTGSALAAPVETVLYGFNVDSNGYAPVASLIADNQGALYGTTAGRGATLRGTGYGTVFKLTPPAKGQMAWTETVLYSFTGGSDGFYPLAGLIADKEGALYGTTQAGGTAGFGTVFKLTPPVRAMARADHVRAGLTIRCARMRKLQIRSDLRPTPWLGNLDSNQD